MERSMGILRGRRTLAWVVLTLPLLAFGVTVQGRSAAGQSAVTLGSTLDQPPASDSLLPSGAFRLDGPSETAPGELSNDPYAGVTTLGLQFYGSGGLAPQPADNEPPALPPLGSTLSRP